MKTTHRMPKYISVTAALLIMLVTLSGCGYTLSRNPKACSADACSVSIPLFMNDTLEPLVEKDVTAAIQEEISMDGRWKLSDRDSADVVVEGRVTGFELLPLSYDAKERILEYRLKIRSEIKVRRPKTDKLVWKGSLESYADFRVTEDVTKTKVRRDEARRMASKKMAGEFIIRVLDVSEFQHEG